MYDQVYSKINIDFENLSDWLTLLRKDLDLKGVGLGISRVPAGLGYTYMHRHERQEEVYIVIKGKGIIHISGKDIDLSPGDIVKVDPEENRALKAAEDSDLVCLIVGALPAVGFPQKNKSNSLIDDGIPVWETLPPWYEGNEKIIALNKKIRAKREGNSP